MTVFLAISPVIVIFLLMTWARRPADVAGALGWVYTAILAAFCFHTAWQVVLLASLAGFIASFPVSLMVVTSIFQINVMEEAGALRRLVAFVKTLAGDNSAVQVMLINVGVGTLLAALGATPVSILPPIMLSLGYSAFAAVALPAIGFDALCTYALLGVPVVIFADIAKGITGQDLTPADVGAHFAQYMPVVTTLIAFSMLWLAGGWRQVRRGWRAALVTGVTAGLIAIGMNGARLPTLTGVAAGLGVIAVMLLYLRLSGARLLDRRRLSDADRAAEAQMGLALAALPWLLLIVFSVLTNFDRFGVYDILFKKLAMPLTIVPGRPERLRLLWQAYTWVLLATLIAIPCYRMSRANVREALRKTLRRALRPAFASGIYFSIAYVLNHSGKLASANGWTADARGANMIEVVAKSAAALFGQAYAGVAAFLGLLGGFISGTESSAIVMLTKLHFDAVHAIFADAPPERILEISLLVAAVSGIGAGLASVISPSKLQNAAAVIDQIGLEGRVIRSTAVIAALMVAAVALMTFVLLALR